jgi:hypothetical protein
MPERLTICFDLPDFRYLIERVFEDEAERIQLLADAQGFAAAAAASAGCPDGAWLRSSLFHAPQLLTGPDESAREAASVGILVWVLQAAVGDDHPGTLGDYLATHDVRLTFSEVVRGVSYSVEATLRDGFGVA